MKKILISLVLLSSIKMVFADKEDVSQLHQQVQQNKLLRKALTGNIYYWVQYLQVVQKLMNPHENDQICFNNLREINNLVFIFNKFPNDGSSAYQELEKLHKALCLKYNDTLLTKSIRDMNDARLIEIEGEKKKDLEREVR